MQILYFRGTWGMEQPTLEANLQKIKAGGFDGVEMAVPAEVEGRHALRALLDALGLELIVQMYTAGRTPEEHARSFEEQYCRAVELGPRLVNAQSGRDIFTTQENLAVYRHAAQCEARWKVPVAHETHRGRATYTLPLTAALLEEMPDLRLAADFSHWCVVHESMLQDQAERMELAIRHVHYIHARVGHPEGPQVSDPRAPEWQSALETHLGWWQRIVDHHKGLGTAVLTITPEFGPPDYMPSLPYTRQPVANLWDVNVFMRDLLKERLKV